MGQHHLNCQRLIDDVNTSIVNMSINRENTHIPLSSAESVGGSLGGVAPLKTASNGEKDDMEAGIIQCTRIK